LLVFVVSVVSIAAVANETTPLALDSLQCYKCVSTIDNDCAKYDEDLFEKSYKVDCLSEKEKPTSAVFSDSKPVGCRKIVQEVEGEERIVRQCAFSGDNVEGLKRTGNKGVRLFYYQCNGDLCNGAARVGQMMAVMIALVLALVLRSGAE